MSQVKIYPHDFLPLPEQSGYGFEPTSPGLISTYVSGRRRARKLYSNVPTTCSISLLFADDGNLGADSQARLFDQWGKVSLSEWTSWFQMKLKTPLGMNYHKCRFLDIPKGPVLSGVSDWLYTAKLELFERPIVGGDLSDYSPSVLAYMGVFDMVLNHTWMEWDDPQVDRSLPKFPNITGEVRIILDLSLNDKETTE